MDLARHKHKFPFEISEYFLSSWNTREIWRLDVPRTTLSIRDLEWHLDYPFFSSNPPAPSFDLVPRAVLAKPREFPLHWDRALAADLAFPIDLCTFGDRLVILDGIHRLLKCVHTGVAVLECRIVPRRHLRTVA